MNNTGNFVLQDRNFNKLWESFKSPSDTLLPSQNMDIGGKLSSRQSETNFSKERFQLRLIPEGNLVLNAINLPTDNPSGPYYTSGTSISDSVPSNPGKQLVFNQSGYIYILDTLNFDGVFTLYSYPKNSNANGSWTPIWTVPDNICMDNSALLDSGTCGFNSICNLGSDKRPICTCPKGYSLLDPKDPYGSCKPDFIQGCEEAKLSPRNDLYYFEVITNIQWINSENYALLKPYTEDQCSMSCMEDCMCLVAVLKRMVAVTKRNYLSLMGEWTKALWAQRLR
nr:g-type lectin s-receptor-like serine/threonine-protein kinase rlk1 [Quercus suber]